MPFQKTIIQALLFPCSDLRWVFCQCIFNCIDCKKKNCIDRNSPPVFEDDIHSVPVILRIWYLACCNNFIVTAGEIPYSQDHWDTMDIIFKYWWAVPIYAILLFAIYAIKNALTKRPTEI